MNWYFLTVVFEKTLASPLDCKEIQSVHSKGDQSWVFFGRNDAEAETPILCLPHAKSWLIGKDSDDGRDWGQGENGTTQDEMAGWHHGLDGRESGWTPEDGVLRFMWSQSRTWLIDWIELNWTELNKSKQKSKLYVWSSFQNLYTSSWQYDDSQAAPSLPEKDL